MNRIVLIFTVIILTAASCNKENNSGSIVTIKKDSLVALKEIDYRPFYHFTPPLHWMNDPNGLVYYKGKYHLFYQYNPNSNVWGPMNWGHASSTDLFNWQDHPIAITPDNSGTIFSGSSVVDVNNTSGFKNGTEDPLVAVYTIAGTQQHQGVAYSNDGGMNWNKYISNPVLPNAGIADFRDPKVSWNTERQKWIMALATGNKISFYSSDDLKTWAFESNFGETEGSHAGVWECPDLFELPVEGTGIAKWVLLVSCNGGPNGGTATQYFVGNFDGIHFTTDTHDVLWIDYGTDNYAGVTYNNIPVANGRRVFIGWMSNWSYAQQVPTNSWRSTMTVPRELTLASSGPGYVLKSNPVTEIVNYENAASDTSVVTAVKSIQVAANAIIKSGSYAINFNADLNSTNSLQLTLGNSLEKLTMSFDKLTNMITIDRGASGQVDFNGQFRNKIVCNYVPQTGQLTDFNILIDKTSMELFIDHGTKVLTTLFFPVYQYNLLKLSGDGNAATISDFHLKKITKSILR